MTIYICIRKADDGNVHAVAAFTNSKMALNFSKRMNKMPNNGGKYSVVTTMLLDTM